MTRLARILSTAAFAAALFAGNSVSALAEATVGKAAPTFTLPAADGASHSLNDFKGKYVVLEWSNPECPFVKKHYSGGNMQRLQKKVVDEGSVWLTINSSAPGKQGNLSAEEATDLMKKQGLYSTAYLLDATGNVGKLYGARTTPHMFVIDPQGTIVYNGAIDDKPSTDAEDIASSKNLVEAALADAKSGKKVAVSATEPYGCSVKYAS